MRKCGAHHLLLTYFLSFCRCIKPPFFSSLLFFWCVAFSLNYPIKDDAGPTTEPMATHGVRRQRQRRPRSIATEGIAAGVGWGSGSQDYHEVRTTVEFLGGEDDKAAKYLARKIVRERVLKHRKLGENEMGSPGRPNPVVERVIDGGLVHTTRTSNNSAPQLIERTTEEQAGADASEAATERGLAGIAGTIAHRRVAPRRGAGPEGAGAVPRGGEAVIRPSQRTLTKVW